ncbi:hypothetical protein Pryu01_03098 [Paraliobacillus ryukyuensis]|uniref:Uncharacterized protein n=1 Tax=Paraliobacillus ryukyuensis TaxID=200904 RepID=A0A366DMG1_9BACI|nr:hypothetical protein [Paraliobacillus ryukyuensis]RBO91287.1 hypothetical protein DES48_11912 [Paraliobacillus ryukyuensis]
MNDITIYSDFIEYEKNPKLMVIRNIDWNNDFIYIPIDLPYRTENIIDFSFDDSSISVLISDLVINLTISNHVGINLSSIKSRIIESGFQENEVSKLIIRIVDFKEVIYIERN